MPGGNKGATNQAGMSTKALAIDIMAFVPAIFEKKTMELMQFRSGTSSPVPVAQGIAAKLPWQQSV